MNKIVVSLSLFVIISCSSNKKIANTKKAEVVKVAENQEVEVVASKEALDKVEKVVEKTRKETKTYLNDVTLDYIEHYAPLAMEQMRRFNVPASITLAQGILESGSGRSNLAQKSNNHFGIKCHTGWKGEKVYHDDDEKGECFRKYKYPATSYQDHSLFLTTRFRYASLFALDKDDYKAWAKGLKKAGYATDPQYPSKLISYIEKYELFKYDEMVLKGKNIEYVSVIKERVQEIKSIENLNNNIYRGGISNTKKNTSTADFHVVKKKESLYSISRQHGLTVTELKRLNGLSGNIIHPGDVLSLKESEANKKRELAKNINDVIRIAETSKKTPAVGFHVVKKKETLYSISRQHGLTVAELKRMNGLSSNIIHIGDELALKTDFVGKTKSIAQTKVQEPKPVNSLKGVNYHTVKKKETLYSISRMYNLSVTELKRLNGLTENTIYIGDELAVKNNVANKISKRVQPSSSSNNVKESTFKTYTTVNGSHIVKRKETLYSISRRYNLTVTELKRLNSLTTNNIAIGQKLKVK